MRTSNKKNRKLPTLSGVRWLAVVVAIIIAAIIIGFTGCKTQERIITKTEYKDRLQHDSLTFTRYDSVYIREKGDTVTVYKFRTIYKNTVRIQKDTVSRADTVVSPPVIKTNTKIVEHKGFYYYLGLFGFWAAVAYAVYKLSKVPFVISKFNLLLKLFKIK